MTVASIICGSCGHLEEAHGPCGLGACSQVLECAGEVTWCTCPTFVPLDRWGERRDPRGGA